MLSSKIIVANTKNGLSYSIVKIVVTVAPHLVGLSLSETLQIVRPSLPLSKIVSSSVARLYINTCT